MDNGILINHIFSLLLKKIVVPTDFHGQVVAIQEMLVDDVSGLVDSLTDFSVDSASVDFSIESKDSSLSETLNKWLSLINADFYGKIPSGLKALSKEYYKERWKYSSFPVLKVSGWKKIDGYWLPTKLYFVDGGSVHGKDKTNSSEVQLLNYDYYLGHEMKNKLDDTYILAKTNGRWFDEYPIPFLIKRGVYHNWQIIQSLKNHELKILDQIIPYLLLVKKGADLGGGNTKVYSNTELQNVIAEFQKLMEGLREVSPDDKDNKSPIRATNFDEEIKHLIPDLSTIFDEKLFAVAEKGILAGLGFIDIAEGVSASRRESVLNPKAFIEEIKSGVDGFKQVLKDVLIAIAQKNKEISIQDIYIMSSPVKSFMTEDFKNQLRQLYDRGNLSKQTATELIAEVDFNTEVIRREQETIAGLETTMYPQIIRNDEGKGIDFPGDNIDKNGNEIPEDKTDETEKEEYNKGETTEELEGAPYSTIKDLPKQVRDNMGQSLQRVFMRVFNNAYNLYKDDIRAFRVAWSVLRRIAKRNKDGKWVRKSKKQDGKTVKSSVTQEILEKAFAEEEKKVMEDTFNKVKLENAEKQGKLLSHLLIKTEDNKA